MARCRHCYDDIREAVITEMRWPAPPGAVRTAWLNEQTRSPFCLRAPCFSETHGSMTHEIKHEPLPAV